MRRSRPPGRAGAVLALRAALIAPLLALSFAGAVAAAPLAQRFDGFNVIAVPGHPFGSASAKRALMQAKQLGANTIAVIPFLWQPSPSSSAIGRGSDMSDPELRTAIREIRAAGFAVVLKPHVWVPESWAGSVEPGSANDWNAWFANYRAALLRIARVAAEENADALAVGTELRQTSHRPEWIELIAAARAAFPRMLFYIAHNVEEAESIPFWKELDVVGVSLYPPLGADRDRAARLSLMHAAADRIDALAARVNKPVVVGEIGLRSAAGAAAKPWESAEERAALADPRLQAEVLADWLSVLNRPTIRGVLIWRWLTDPDAGGPADTDFTVQGKPATDVLLCAWTINCGK